MNNEPGNQQLLLCRNEYIRLAREVDQKGLSRNEIETSKTTLVEFKDGRWFIKPIAFLPTGVALGCPLPQIRLEKLFYRTAQLVEEWMQGKDGPDFPSFAYVPPQSYHITILNRSHYEYNKVVPLTLDERQAIGQFVLKLQLGKISVVTSGMFLTHTGRLFIKCLVFDDNILNLRTMLSQTYPQLRTNIPRLVHIKIGHLMRTPSREELLEFSPWLERLGYHVITRIDFADLYTPSGRIEL